MSARSGTQDANANRAERQETKTDLSMRLGALGARGALLTPENADGMDLALKADTFRVSAEWEKVSGETDTAADASRVRLVLEGGRPSSVRARRSGPRRSSACAMTAATPRPARGSSSAAG